MAVIPGNPGDAVFYAGLVGALQALGHEVTVASHLLLPAPPDTLLPYALHHVEAIERHLRGSGRTIDDVDLVLAGHSVGAYLSYLIVARRLLPVSRLFLLCPFLSRPALSGRLILKLASSPRLLRACLGGWRLLPRRLQRWLVEAVGVGPHRDWVLEAIAAGLPLAWGAMAAAEWREIASRPDVSYLPEQPLLQDPRGCLPILCHRDRWAPRRWSGVRPLDGLDHAFVVDPAQCRIVAGLIHEHLTEVRSAERSPGRTAP